MKLKARLNSDQETKSCDPNPTQPAQTDKNGQKNVGTLNNDIYFYSDVEDETVLQLTTNLTEMKNAILFERQRFGGIEYFNVPINLHIRSDGGSIYSGFVAMDVVTKIASEVPVIAHVDGICASAATLMLLPATKRIATNNSYVLIHQARSFMFGKHQDLIDEIGNLEMLVSRLRQIYLTHTKITPKQLDQFMKDEKIFDAHTCLKYGIIDEIISYEQTNRFKNKKK